MGRSPGADDGRPERENMKKIFESSGKFLGTAKKIKESKKNIEITFSGDFPGMKEKTIVYIGGLILFEDETRVYITY